MIARDRQQEPEKTPRASKDASLRRVDEAGASAQPAHRVIALLNRDQVDFIDGIGKDAQFSSGIKLTRTQILAAMVNALKQLQLSGEGIKTASQFEQRIVEAMRDRRPHSHPADGKENR